MSYAGQAAGIAARMAQHCRGNEHMPVIIKIFSCTLSLVHCGQWLWVQIWPVAVLANSGKPRCRYLIILCFEGSKSNWLGARWTAAKCKLQCIQRLQVEVSMASAWPVDMPVRRSEHAWPLKWGCQKPAVACLRHTSTTLTCWEAYSVMMEQALVPPATAWGFE